jgi:FixJ family two-component response regulator
MAIPSGAQMRQGPLIAVVDDDASIRDTTCDLLESAGYSAVAFSSPGDLLASERLHKFACLITDMRMPGMSGIELYERLRATGWRIPTILISAYPDELGRAHACRAGILSCLRKPFTSEVLLERIAAAVDPPGPE